MEIVLLFDLAETRIIKRLTSCDYNDLIEKYNGKIKVSKHALFRLNEMQRGLFDEEALVETLNFEKPVLFGIQKNLYYAVFFSKKNGFMKVIFKLDEESLKIITFYVVKKLPNV